MWAQHKTAWTSLKFFFGSCLKHKPDSSSKGEAPRIHKGALVYMKPGPGRRQSCGGLQKIVVKGVCWVKRGEGWGQDCPGLPRSRPACCSSLPLTPQLSPRHRLLVLSLLPRRPNRVLAPSADPRVCTECGHCQSLMAAYCHTATLEWGCTSVLMVATPTLLP